MGGKKTCSHLACRNGRRIKLRRNRIALGVESSAGVTRELVHKPEDEINRHDSSGVRRLALEMGKVAVDDSRW